MDQTDDKFVVGIDRNVALVTWDGKSSVVENIKYLCEVDNDITSNRLNDGKCDRYGRLWTGEFLNVKQKSFKICQIKKKTILDPYNSIFGKNNVKNT